MDWGAGCTTTSKFDLWMAQYRVVSEFLPKKPGIQSVKLVTLPGGEHGYLVQGAAAGPASRTYYLMVIRDYQPRLFQFDGVNGPDPEAIASTDDPVLRGDQISTAERQGTGDGMHYKLKTWRLDLQSLKASLLKQSSADPVKTP